MLRRAYQLSKEEKDSRPMILANQVLKIGRPTIMIHSSVGLSPHLAKTHNELHFPSPLTIEYCDK